MIMYVTSTSESISLVRTAANKEADKLRKLGHTVKVVHIKEVIPHSKQSKSIDQYLNSNKTIVMYSLLEIPLLRLMKENKDNKIELRVIALEMMLDKRQHIELRVNDGEFIDPWPNGFFDARMELLF